MNPWYAVVLLWLAVIVMLATHVYERRHADDPWAPWDDLLKQERGRR